MARRGDDRAIDLLFSRHIPALRSMAVRFLRNEAEAEDVVQESLLSAFLHLSQYAGRSQFRTWLFSILLNSARTKVRRRRPDRYISLEEVSNRMMPDPSPQPDQIVARHEIRKIVRDALNGFSPEFRTAYYLCYVKGLSKREAADRVGVNPQTFKVRLFRGRRKLANKLSALNERSRQTSMAKADTGPIEVSAEADEERWLKTAAGARRGRKVGSDDSLSEGELVAAATLACGESI
jgi:RNA polymerase sigma-70 factor, ECF subfamily